MTLQRLVLVRFRHVPVVCIAARLHHNLSVGAWLPHLRSVTNDGHGDIFEGVGVGIREFRTAASLLLSAEPFDFAAVLALDSIARTIRIGNGAAPSDVRFRHRDPRGNAEDGRQVSLASQILYTNRIEVVRDLRGCDVDNGRGAADGDALGHAGRIHFNVDGGGEADADLDTLTSDGRKSRELERKRVGPRCEGWQPIRAVNSGDPCARPHQSRTADGDRRARDRCFRIVGNGADDGAGRGRHLGADRASGRNNHNQQGRADSEPTPIKHEHLLRSPSCRALGLWFAGDRRILYPRRALGQIEPRCIWSWRPLQIT